MATIRELITKWGFDVDDSQLKKMEKQTKQLRSSFVKMGAVATAALAAVIVPAAKLQAAIKDTLTLSEETGVAFAKLEQGMTRKAMEMAEKLGFSATEVATGFYQVLSTGAEALSPRFNALSEVALKMAKTVGLEPADAIEKLNDTMNAFTRADGSGPRFQEVADILFKGSILAATTVPQLTEAMRQAAPAATKMNITIAETTAILDTFAQKGFKGSEAGNAFRRIMLRMAAPSGEAKKALKELGVEIATADGKIRPIITIFRELQKAMAKQTEAQRLVSLKAIAGQFAFAQLGGVLEGNLDTMKEWVTTLENSGGALDRAFKIKMSAASEQLHHFWITLKNTAATLGGPMLDSLGSVIHGITAIVKTVREFLSTHPELTRLIATWGGLALAVVAVSSAFAAALLSLKLFAIAAAGAGIAVAGTLFWAIALGAMLAVLVGVVWQNKDAFKELWEINKNAQWSQIALEFIGWITQIENLTQKVKDLSEELNTLKFVWDAITAILQRPLEIFKPEERRKGLEELGKRLGAGRERGAVFGERTVEERAAGFNIPAAAAGGPTTQTQHVSFSGDINMEINAPGGDATEIADAVQQRMNQIMRGTAEDLGQ